MTHGPAHLDRLPVGLWLADDSGACVAVNRAWAALHDLDVTGAPGVGWLDAVHPDDRASVATRLRTALAAAPGVTRLTYRTTGGRVVRFELHPGLFEPGADLPAAAWTGVSVDVTDLHPAAPALSADDPDARREAERLATVGTLASGMAHEVNNQLAAILGFAQLAQRRAGDSPAAAPIARILVAGGRAAAIVRGVLAFARRQPMRPARTSAATLLGGAQEALSAVLGGRCTVDVAPDAAGLHVDVDAAQIERALVALAENARAAIGESGRVTVSARPWPTAAAPSHLQVRFVDDGHGMAPDVQSRAFEPFFTTRALGEGVGLGLSTVHGIVHQSGGTVAIESAVGLGTTVEIRLPLVEPPPAAAPRAGAILVVDDEPSVLELVTEALGEEGLATRTATDPKAAAALVDAGAVRLAIVDASLLDRDGGVLARALWERDAPVPTVLVSGSADAFANRRLPPGCRLLAKPFTLEGLLEAVLG